MAGEGQRAAQLKFESVTCVRGRRFLFGDVSFTLNAGDAMVVTGPNGVGKSSLLRLAAGLLTAEKGRVIREGQVALADEYPALDPALPLLDALRFWAGIDGGDPRAALASVGLDHLDQVPVRMLSTGQRRRATLARTIVAMLEGVIAVHRMQGGIAVIASHQPVAVDGAHMLALTSSGA
jgi:heme exporter protein A